MAYVRKKGNQVVIVHGERDPESGKVQQRTLFTFYAKAEIRAVLGEQQRWFRSLLEKAHPQIRFDWAKIDEALTGWGQDSEGAMPDLAPYRKERVEGRFREALVGMVRELLVADPQTLATSARLLRDNRYELEYLRHLMDWRLRMATEENAVEGEFNRDTPFYWRTLMNRREVPPEARERVFRLYQEGELDEAEALTELLVEAWDNFADGHNVLGLVARERAELGPEAKAREGFEAAKACFERAVEVGRGLFPKRIAKKSYWRDHATRPYIRALCYLAGVLNRLEDYEEALQLCDRLDKRCGLDMDAALGRIPVHLNRGASGEPGAYAEAAAAARYVHRLHEVQNLPLALALFELGELGEARAHLVAAAIRYPRATRRLAGIRGGRVGGRPASKEEARDYNAGVDFIRDLEPYLRARGRAARRFLSSVVKEDRVAELMAEAEDVRRKWSADRSGDRTWFDRKQELESMELAEATAAALWSEVG